MKVKILGGAAVAVAATALALAGAVPAQARRAHHAAKPAAEKHACGGKNGCPSMNKSEDKAATTEKPEAKPAEGK
ncbi:MAG: hypothetical protein ACM3PD_04425 [Chloroflexota bacterium]